MRYNVGIDFGTHQTKVCIEDSLNKRVPVYEFLEYLQPDGTKTVLFPSVVQINKDRTLSYGFVDRSQCLCIEKEQSEAPRLILPDEPTIILPNEPKYEKIPKEPVRVKGVTKGDWTSVLQSFAQENCPEADTEHSNWEYKKNNIERSNEAMRLKWLRDCNVAQADFDLVHQQWEQDVDAAKALHENEMRIWRDSIKKEELYFRYFKQASFHSFVWSHSIPPESLSILYLTYLCFCIRERIGFDYTVQFGAPMGASKQLSQQQRTVAKRIWSTAHNMATHYGTKAAFLSSTIDELLITLKDASANDSRVSIIPEASAGLLSIRTRIGHGMFLLVDIGGGTTDVGMCSVYQNPRNESILGIHKVYSFNKGLNFVFEEYQKAHPKWSLADIQDLFWEQKDRREFGQAINVYRGELYSQLNRIVTQIIATFKAGKSWHGLDVEKSLYPAIKNKPILLCGGGSVFSEMRDFSTSGLHFSDKRLINRSLLRIDNLSNAGSIPDEYYPILATAYGLSKQVDIEEELNEKPLEKYFDHLPRAERKKMEEKSQENDYSLMLGCC